MTTLYELSCGYTKLGVGTAPASAPTITVVDSNNNILVAALTAVTALTNLPGAYRYSYSGADGLIVYGLFHTSDLTMDQYDIFVSALVGPAVRDIQSRLPAALTAAGNIKADVEEWKTVIPAGLTATGKYLQVALERWLTDDAAGTPAALSATGHFLQAMLERWITDDAAGTPLALTGAHKVQADSAVGTLPTLGADSKVLISTDAQDLSASLSVNIGRWLNVVPAALTATGKFIQAIVMRWKTDDVAGTPDALSSGKLPADVKLWLAAAPDALSSGKVPADLKLWLAAAPAALTASGYVQTTVLRWLTDNAAGTPLALTAAWLLQVDAVSGGATPQQIWDALVTALVTPGSIGELLTTIRQAQLDKIEQLADDAGTFALTK